MVIISLINNFLYKLQEKRKPHFQEQRLQYKSKKLKS